MFLMRCLFTMFAEDVGLLPEDSFRRLLERCEQDPDAFPPIVGQLWEAMDARRLRHAHRGEGEAVQRRVLQDARRAAAGPRGDRRAAPGRVHTTGATSIRRFSARCWSRRSTRKERRRLGAHYTPRAYVERLVVGDDHRAAARRLGPVCCPRRSARRRRAARRTRVATIRAFHEKLCRTRVLDPACGTGNFLYVSLELMKRLEGEVLEALADLGGQEALTGLEGHTRRSASVPRAGDQPPRRRHRRAGALDRPSAMAHPHQGRLAVRADLESLQEHRGAGRGARRRQGFEARRERQADDPAGAGRPAGGSLRLQEPAPRRSGPKRSSSSATRRSSAERRVVRAA